MAGSAQVDRIPEEVRADMVDRYKRGQSARFIGYAHDRAAATVTAVLKAAGVEVRPAGIPKAMKSSWYRKKVA